MNLLINKNCTLVNLSARHDRLVGDFISRKDAKKIIVNDYMISNILFTLNHSLLT